VLIEARIVEASDTWGKSLGVKLGGGDLRTINGGDAGYSVGSGNRVAIGGTYDAVGATNGAFDSSALTSASSQFVNLPAQSINTVAPSTFALTLFNSSANRFLNLELSALEADGKGLVISSPRVVTADQAKAIIQQGTEYPYEQATSSGATSVSFRKAVLSLEVTPQITPEGNIILDLNVNNDTAGQQLPGGMAINTKQVQTQVLVENGGTVVIGGIFTMNETDSVNKVPVLGDIPLLGNLFKQTTNSIDKQEMLVFITPKVIADQGAVR
jgi:type IV pilus assembly protein PilQ